MKKGDLPKFDKLYSLSNTKAGDHTRKIYRTDPKRKQKRRGRQVKIISRENYHEIELNSRVEVYNGPQFLDHGMHKRYKAEK